MGQLQFAALVVLLAGTCGVFCAHVDSVVEKRQTSEGSGQATKPIRKYSEAEICVGRCFPLVVSRFQPGTGGAGCECRSERLKLEAP